VTNRKSFGNKFFLDFWEKFTCSNVSAAFRILLEYSLTNRKSFGNKFFLDSTEKITCSNFRAAFRILLEYSLTNHVTNRKSFGKTLFCVFDVPDFLKFVKTLFLCVTHRIS